VAVVVGDGVIRRKLDIIVRLQLDDVGEEVTALQGEVLDDEVESLGYGDLFLLRRAG
jgi:16S rRNA C967 or C1407 C5-methylase (RsmB/RsmF family)